MRLRMKIERKNNQNRGNYQNPALQILQQYINTDHFSLSKQLNMTETVDQTQEQQPVAADASATKSALKDKTVRQRRSSARKVVISDNPMNQTGKSGTMRSMTGGQTAMSSANTTENAQKTAAEGGPMAGAGATSASGNKSLLGTKKRTSKPAYLQSLNESEKQANFKIIDSMNKKISYLKNPRHKVSKAPILMTTAIKENMEVEKMQKATSFRVEPTVVNFVDYQLNGIYEISVKVTNNASVSKRIKFIPPATEMFTIRRVKYPSNEKGDVAPGMSLTFAVTFQAPSFSDFDDFITFITEENSFKLPLRARREPPDIKLVNPMDCMNSWLGDRVDMAFRCVNQGGDGGFKFFCDKDEDDLKQTDADSIKIGSFTLNPAEFYLYSGNAIDIYVTFNPDQEGYLEEKLILACDNQTSQYYKVVGNGAMLDLDIISVDNKEVDFKANPFETMYFENTNPTSESMRTIKIKNSSAIAVPYHWSIYKQKNSETISLADEETHYRIEPDQGKIAGGETLEFKVYFCPQHAEPYFEFADLIVEDIPINAVRQPSEGLKNFAAANQQKSKVPMPIYAGSNTQFLSIPMIQFNLRGQGNSCKVDVQPPITFFEGDNFINQVYTETVQFLKLTQGVVHYKLRMESKNRDTFHCDVRVEGGQTLSDDTDMIEGEISKDKLDFQIQVRSEECGKAIACFYIEIEDGPPVSFSVQADFRGPIVELLEPVVNLELAKVNTQQHRTLTLVNESPIPASFIIKNSKNKKLQLDNYITLESLNGGRNNAEDSLQSGSLVVGKPINTKRGNIINFDTSHYTLRPHEKKEIRMQADCVNQESIEEYFEILINDAEPLFFQLLGEVQTPQVYLNRDTVELGRIYAGIKELVNADQGKHRTQALELVNFGNLPVYFNWEDIDDPERAIARFEPKKGVIPPKKKVKISLELTVFMGGAIDELFLCDIQDLELPLGFEVKADAFGLNVAYMTSEDQSLASTQALSQDQDGSAKVDTTYGNMNKLQMVSFTNCKINKHTSQKFILKNLSGIKTMFDFSSEIYEPISHEAPQQKSEIQIALEQEQQRLKAEQEANQHEESQNGRKKGDKNKQIRFAASVKSNTGFKDSIKRRTQPILSDEHEQTQKFSSVTGNTFTQTKALEKQQAFYLSNNKGIALVFTPNKGELMPNAEVPITVTLYNNVCGKFDDTIVSKVKGLPNVNFPVRINISGSPVVIPPNQVGLNYNTIPPTLPMPTIVANSAGPAGGSSPTGSQSSRTKGYVPAISKTFKIKNTGIRSLQVDWRVFDQSDLDKVDNDVFSINVVKNQSFDKKHLPYKFRFTALEPEESQNSPFEVAPKQVVVNARSVQEFQVTFNPTKDVGNFKTILLASPELSQEEIEIADDQNDLPSKGSLGTIALKLNANTISPELSIDKSNRMDGGKQIKIKKWAIAADEAPNVIKKLTFSNDTKADLTFNFSVNGPFEIVKSKTNSGAKHPLASQQTPSKIVKQKVETAFCLQPLKIVELHVRFIAPKAADQAEWPMIMHNQRNGELLTSFSNGDTQTFDLLGQLLRPKLMLLTEYSSRNDKAQDELDFGTCNVDMKRTITIFLSNITEVTANWMLNYVKFPKKQTISKYTTTAWEEENIEKLDDPDVFEFSLAQGSLKGKSEPLRKAPEGLIVPPVPKDEFEKQFLPCAIQVNFRPKKNILYKSKFRFTVENGLPCDVILKGRGSYEEDQD